MSNGTRVSDFFDDSDEFESILDDAERKASKEFEINFTSDIRSKFDEYGEDMFLSEKQCDTLQRIASK